jgi:hypothetical protein
MTPEGSMRRETGIPWTVRRSTRDRAATCSIVKPVRLISRRKFSPE